MAKVLRILAAAVVLASSLSLCGCGDSGGTVQPPKVEPTPPATGPVNEPPSTDEK